MLFKINCFQSTVQSDISTRLSIASVRVGLQAERQAISSVSGSVRSSHAVSCFVLEIWTFCNAACWK